MSEFDAARALREEIQGLGEVRTVLKQNEREAEEQMGQAEQRLNAARKLLGFCDIELERKRTALRELTEVGS